MHGSGLTDILWFLLASVITVPIFRRFGLSAVLGYLFVGLLLGPFGFKVISDPDSTLAISELGVVMMLFVIGLELSPPRLWQMRHRIFGAGSVQVGASALALFAVFIQLGVGWKGAVILAVALALSSTAVVLQLLAERKQLNAPHGKSAFGILLFQDIVAIPLLAAIPLLGHSQTPGQIDGYSALKAIGMLLLVVFIGRYVMRQLFRAVAWTQMREIFTATALLIVIGTGWLMNAVGLSMGLGRVSGRRADGGFRIPARNRGAGRSVQRAVARPVLHIGRDDHQPPQHLRQSVVHRRRRADFVGHQGVGALRHRHLAMPDRCARSAAAGRQHGAGRRIRLRGVLRFGEIRPAAAGMARPAGRHRRHQHRLDAPDAAGPAGSVQKQPRKSEAPVYDTIDEGHPRVIIAGFGRVGQIIGRMLRARKIPFIALENSVEQVAMSRKYGNLIYFGDPCRLEVLQSAHIAQAELLVIASDDPESSLKVARLAKRHFPHLRVIARARNRQHAFRLMDLGVPAIRETLFSSIEIGKLVFIGLGFTQERAEEFARLFLAHDESILAEQYLVHDDEAALMASATQAYKDLEALFDADRRDSEPPDQA